MAGTGMLLSYRRPHGDGTGRTLFLGFGRHALVVHLFLNWQWLVKVAASKHVWRLAAGILTGLLVVGAFLLLSVEKSAQNGKETAVHLQNDR